MLSYCSCKILQISRLVIIKQLFCDFLISHDDLFSNLSGFIAVTSPSYQVRNVGALL